MKRFFLLFLFAATLFIADFLLKAYVHHFLPVLGWASSIYPYGGIAVFENWCGIDFSINHVLNKGAAWGMLSNFHEYLFYGRILIIICMLFYLFFFSLVSEVAAAHDHYRCIWKCRRSPRVWTCDRHVLFPALGLLFSRFQSRR